MLLNLIFLTPVLMALELVPDSDGYRGELIPGRLPPDLNVDIGPGGSFGHDFDITIIPEKSGGPWEIDHRIVPADIIDDEGRRPDRRPQPSLPDVSIPPLPDFPLRDVTYAAKARIARALHWS